MTPDSLTALAHPARSALLFDLDGTLLDIAPTPSAVIVPDTLKAALASLQKSFGGAIAIVTGRPLRDLDPLLAPLLLPAVGGHGAEVRIRPGETEQHAELLPEPLREKLLAFNADGLVIEQKGYSVAIHYRQAPHRESEIAAFLAELLRDTDSGMEILRGKSVFEIKPAGLNKGKAVLGLMTRGPFAGRRPIYFGDDVTDQYVFAILESISGTGVSVGGEMPGARYSFNHSSDVRQWLTELAATV